MPQPLSRVRSGGGINIGNYGIKPNPFQERPQLALMALEVISRFSLLEMFLMVFYARMLGGPKDIAAQIYLNMETKTEKQRALNTIAQNLGEEPRKAFDDLRSKIKTVQKSRDNFAHGIWGIHSEIPDGILWCTAKHMAMMDIENIDEFREGISVYTVKDLNFILKSIDDALESSHNLEVMITAT